MHQVCPKCQQRYPDNVSRCATDDTPLRADPFIGVRIDRWTLTEFVGQGAMGVVYAAEPTAAIKILNARRAVMQPDLVRRFEIEAEAATRLTSPHIARVFASGTTEDGHLYIAMELLRGEPLDVILERSRRLPAAAAVTIAHQIARALDEAHRRQVVHRDLKPANIFVEPAPGGGRHVRVLDFGVARINSESIARSRTGSVAGTPGYMSPEQLRGEPDIDGRSDIYSLGVVLYRLLAGHNPFRAPGGVMATLRRHLEYVPPPPPDVPPVLAGVVSRLLAKSRDERPQTMAEVTHLLDLTGLVGGGGDAETIPGISRAFLTAAGLFESTPRPEPAPVVEPGLRFVPASDPGVDEPVALPERDPRPPASQPPAPGSAAPQPAMSEASAGPASTSSPSVTRPSPSLTPASAAEPRVIASKGPASQRASLRLVAGLVGVGAAVGLLVIAVVGGPTQPPGEPSTAHAASEHALTSVADAAPTVSDPMAEVRAAEALASDEQWQAAVDAFGGILRLHPDHVAAREGRARALREASNERLWRDLVELVDSQRWVEASTRLDAFPTDSVYTARAMAHRGAIERGWVEFQEQVARQRLQQGDLAEVAAIIDALTAHPAGSNAAITLAKALEDRRRATRRRATERPSGGEPDAGRPDAAAAEPDASRRDPYDDAMEAALQAMRRGDREAAIRLFARTARLRPRSHVPYQRLCGIYKAKQDYQKALGACQKWLETEPNASYVSAIRRNIEQLHQLLGRESPSENSASP